MEARHRGGLEECERLLAAAAAEERAARAAFDEGIGPWDPGWTAADQPGFDARLARWRAASHALVAALEELKLRQGGSDTLAVHPERAAGNHARLTSP